MSCGDAFTYQLPAIVNPSSNSKLKIMYFPSDARTFLDFDASSKVLSIDAGSTDFEKSD